MKLYLKTERNNFQNSLLYPNTTIVRVRKPSIIHGWQSSMVDWVRMDVECGMWIGTVVKRRADYLTHLKHYIGIEMNQLCYTSYYSLNSTDSSC